MQDRATPEDQDRIELGHLSHDLSFVSRILRAHIVERNAPFFDAHGVAGGEVALLNLIGQNPGISQKGLAEVVVLKKSAITKLVNEMERNGLITRRKEGDDLRVNALHLTEGGQEKLARMRADMDALQSELLAVLSPAERGMLFELMWRLIDGLGGIPLTGHRSKS